MAIEHGYASLAEAKARLDILGDAQDAKLEQMIEAASRQIDGWCSRTFYAETATRTLTAYSPVELTLDRDLISLTSVVVDENADRVFETTWAATDYELGDGPPYQVIYTSPVGTRSFPVFRWSVQVAGSWGYAATVPHAVREACLVQVARLFKRSDAPFGIAGSADHGQLQTIGSVDPDVRQLIAPYRRFGLVGV